MTRGAEIEGPFEIDEVMARPDGWLERIAAGLRDDLAWDLPAMVAAARVPLLVLAARAGAGLGEAGPVRGPRRRPLPPPRPPARWPEVVGGFADTVLGTGAGSAGQPGPSSA
jgi:hypothetical protein